MSLEETRSYMNQVRREFSLSACDVDKSFMDLIIADDKSLVSKVSASVSECVSKKCVVCSASARQIRLLLC